MVKQMLSALLSGISLPPFFFYGVLYLPPFYYFLS